MYLSRQLRLLPKASIGRSITTSSTHYTTTTGTPATPAVEHIEIPNRIERSPTDILKALASTVGRDHTAPHYKYHDDPFLIPMSNMAKRTYAMSKEAGRKAAKWIKEEHRELFLHQEAQPAIEKFAPSMVYTEESEVDESSLGQLIELGELKDAVLVYNLLEQKGMTVSPELKQSLLELVCFHNNQDPLPEEYIEERWFLQNNQRRERHGKTWKDGDLAEKLYAEIEPKTPQTYAALIRGMAKYLQCERAYALLQEAGEKQIQLDTNTYNSIIQIISFLKDNAEQRWQLCTELLQQMSQQKLRPNLGTLNAILQCISTFGNFKLARSSALKVLPEFKQLGVSPSLGSYYYLLIIFCRERGPVSHVIVDILNEIAGREFTVEHPKDTYFFATAMDVCRNHLNDKALAKKVNELLHTGNNYDLVGDSFKESIYYRNYLALLCQTESIEDFMLTYDLLVPNIYIPEPGIMEEVLRTIEINAAVEHVPRIWSDMVVFDHTHRESLLLYVLRIMVDNRPNAETPSQAQLPEQCAKVALDMYNKIEESVRRIKKVSFTGQMLGDILTLLVRGDNYEKANEVFSHIDKNQHRIPGTPAESALQEYVEASIKEKSPSQALAALQYAVDNNMESSVIAKRIHDGFTLNETHLAKLKSLVGESFLEK
ncbi:protein PTCD3 homolog, mitochondrial [Drosophila guanche]|uniref:Small ribosomal subunit protein mS39 n=1 Tax=Drosophila guanche TaxID=7266 RepID=A0A3B0J3L8_DROGU|nr:protein PTCD3 homolog, mitochondrial [Drosophila guanche]SPP73893.1 blast:Protein PTCD3 homolog%2C mitochondrial [Drosophila guanche]